MYGHVLQLGQSYRCLDRTYSTHIEEPTDCTQQDTSSSNVVHVIGFVLLKVKQHLLY